MADHHDDDLVSGYKVGEKKTVDEYAQLDAEDEALNRWKQSLGLYRAPSPDPNDPRHVIILQLGLEFAGRPDIVIDLEQPGLPFTIKEGAEYCIKVKFRVQHNVISGLRYLQRVRRRGIQYSRSEEMMGSFSPNTESNPVYEVKFAIERAPNGMLYRGQYDVLSDIMDDDRVIHLERKWCFNIKRSWD